MASLKAKSLRIGFLIDDGVVKVQPPIARAVREVVAALKAAGHEGISPWVASSDEFSDGQMQFSNGTHHHMAMHINSGKRPSSPTAARAVARRSR
jgi:Asp-tRNA(Asn)/Glu-tRNA(Gln) amidotransferase A subunit family amidase